MGSAAVNDERFIGYLNKLLTFCLPPHRDDEAAYATERANWLPAPEGDF